MSWKTQTSNCPNSTFHGPPHIYMELPEGDLHPCVNELRDTASHCLSMGSALGCSCSDLNHPALACALCSCSCLQTLPPMATFLPLTWTLSKRPLPGQGPASSPWPLLVLSVTTGPQLFPSVCELGRKTFTPFGSPVDGRSHSVVPWASDYYKVYCNTCQFTHSVFYSSRNGQMPPGQRVGRIPGPGTCRIFQGHLVLSELQADPVGSGWPGHIYPFIPNSEFSLEEPAFSLPSPHIHPVSPLQMCAHTSPMDDIIQTVTHPCVNQLLQIDLRGGGKKGWGDIQHIPQSNIYLVISDVS